MNLNRRGILLSLLGASLCLPALYIVRGFPRPFALPTLPLGVWLSLASILSLTAAFVWLAFGIQLIRRRWISLLTMFLHTFFVVVGFAGIYRQLGIEHGVGQPPIKDAAACLYFSVVTFTTLGYGDFYPTEAARPIAAFEALFGYLYLGLLVAVVATVLATKARELTTKNRPTALRD